MQKEEWKQLLQMGRTPMYVFDLRKLRERVAFLREHLPSSVELCYAVKANTFIAGSASALVEWLEICSPGEYQICKKMGISPKKFVISGVNKNPEWIEETVSCGCEPSYYTVESINQFELLRNTAKKKSERQRMPLLLRLTSGNQFGLDESEIEKIVSEYQTDSLVEICGIQFFSGTQKTSLKKLQRELRQVDELLVRLRDTYGFEAKKLEYGPGFPVMYFEGERFEESEFLKGFSEMLTKLQFKGEISLELGRSIAASCGTYLTSVVDAKCNHGERYAIVDGGAHQLVYYGQFMAMKHPNVQLVHVSELTGDGGNAVECEWNRVKQSVPQCLQECFAEEKWNICGSLCTVNDILVKQMPFSNLQVGDILAFENTGAYCVTEGIALFLSRDLPTVILEGENGRFQVVREAISTADFNGPAMSQFNCLRETNEHLKLVK